MKLVAQSDESWQYQLSQNEADVLIAVVKKFPATAIGPAQISKMETSAKAAERRKLLAESLADHRRELKQMAATLLADNHWQKCGEGRLLTLHPEAREVLLQVLNDIRVGCWRALGESEALDQPVTSKRQLGYRNLMDLAGYFEMNLLGSEE